MSHDKALRAIRRFCVACQGGFAKHVRSCPDVDCALYLWRLEGTTSTGSANDVVQAATRQPALLEESPLRVIRRYCMACAGSRQDIRYCESKECSLWSYRFGVTPATWRRVSQRRHTPQPILLPGLKK